MRRLLLPARQINGERMSSGKLFRGTTAYKELTVPKQTVNPRRIRFGRDKVGKLVMATHAIRAALDPQCPRAAYQRAKKEFKHAIKC